MSLATRRVEVVRLDLDHCLLSWNSGQCAPGSKRLEAFEGLSDWTAYDEAGGLVIAGTDFDEGTGALRIDKTGTATVRARARKAWSRPVDWSLHVSHRIMFHIPSGVLAQVASLSVILESSTPGSLTDYFRWTLSTGLVAGKNRWTYALAAPTATVGAPSLGTLRALHVGFDTGAAGNTPTGILVDDLRRLVTPTDPCYQTLASCSDPDHYRLNVGTKSRYFTWHNAPRLVQVDAYRCIDQLDPVVGMIDPTRGLGPRDSIRCHMKEFFSRGEAEDPNLHLRSPGDVGGDFWPQFLAQHPYHQNRTAMVLGADLDDQGREPPLAEWEAQRYVIHKMALDEQSGGANVEFRDPLSRLEDAKTHEVTTGELRDQLLAAGGSFELAVSPDEPENQYPSANFYVLIGDEILFVTSRVGRVFSPVSRNQWGTDAADHAAGENVQLCLAYEGVTPLAAWEDLHARAGLSSSDLDIAGATTEMDDWMSEYDHNVIFPKPKQVSQTLQDFLKSTNSMEWWDPEEQKGKFRHGRPLNVGETPLEIDVRIHVQRGTFRLTLLEAERVNEVVFHIAPRNWALDLSKPSTYLHARKAVDVDARSSLEYGDERARSVFAYWLGSALRNEALAHAARHLTRYRDPPRLARFVLGRSMGAGLKMGQVARLSSERILDSQGRVLPTDFLITRRQRVARSQVLFAFEAIELRLFGRWWYWAPDTAGDYPADPEVAHWCDDDGEMPDGTPGYSLL